METNGVYGVTICATRDELDQHGTIPDANWPAAWECYASMMRGAAEAMFPGAEVEVIEQPSTRGIVVSADDGYNYEADAAMGAVAERVFALWCEWASKQVWCVVNV